MTSGSGFVPRESQDVAAKSKLFHANVHQALTIKKNKGYVSMSELGKVKLRMLKVLLWAV